MEADHGMMHHKGQETTMPMPTRYTQELGEEICTRLAEGESLRSICKSAHIPPRQTVYLWLLRNESGFAEKYALARELQADTLADEITDIADDSTNDYVERQMRDGTTARVFDKEAVLRARLRVDARKWVAAKLRPGRYGERIDHTSSDGSMSPKEPPTYKVTDV